MTHSKSRPEVLEIMTFEMCTTLIISWVTLLERIGDLHGQWTPFSKWTFAVLVASPPLTPASVIFNMAFAFVS